MKRLNSKVAIITGAAMGMGMETAKLFSEEGAKVVVADFNQEAGNAVVKEIVGNGGTATFCKVDISNASQVEAMIKFAVSTYGRIDCAVNNAALKPDNNKFEDLDEEYWDRLQAVDLKGTALCMKYEIRQFVAQGGGGAIVNISSINAFKPTTGNPAYQAFKHGVVGLTKAAAFEYGTQGIRINSVAPGAIRTPMLTAALKGLNIEEKDIIPTMSLIGRLGEPREVAHGSLFLCSDDASYVHGTTLHVGGGFELI
jgi:NAD(P)-dependent dehydrogenase (short-subunit alcohol dehydrogenase family)